MTTNQDILTHRPIATVPSNLVMTLPAVTASAGASSLDFAILTAKRSMILDGARLILGGGFTVTDQTTAAVGFLNRWRAGTRICQDGAQGCFPFLKAQTVGLLDFKDIASFQGFAWVGYLTAAVTAASDTGGTLQKFGTSSLSAGLLESTAILNGGTQTLIVDPGTTAQETIQVSAYDTGTGVFTIASSGVFAASHAAGALVVLAGPLLWSGTSTAATAGVSTGTTLTAVSPSALTSRIAVGSQLIFEPFTSNAETVPVGTLNTGTGAFTIAASYNGGKFLNAHANGCAVGLPLSKPTFLQKDDVLSFKWVQSATTGLALHSDARLELYFRPSGS